VLKNCLASSRCLLRRTLAANQANGQKPDTPRNIHSVLSPRPCTSNLAARAGVEPATFRFSDD
jgi:hypothetical protein